MNYKLLLFIPLFILYSCKIDKTPTQKDSISSEKQVSKAETDAVSTIQITGDNLNDILIGKVNRENISFDNSDLYINGGALISGVYHGKEYNLSTISGKNDIIHYVLFEEVTSKNNIPSFKIIDVLKIDEETRNLLSNSEIELYIVMASKDQVANEEIIAIATYEDNKVFTEIHKAWRADRETEKFIEIPTEGITVDNVLY